MAAAAGLFNAGHKSDYVFLREHLGADGETDGDYGPRSPAQ